MSSAPSSPIDYNRIADAYARNRTVHPEVLSGLLNHRSLNSDARALEVGCGTGNYIIAVQQASGCHAWGIDPSHEMLARAQEKASPVRLSPGQAEKLPFENAFFDLIFSVDVIHHVKGRDAYFLEVVRALKPGGVVCTVTDSEEIIRNRRPLSEYFPDTIPAELQRYPSIEWLRGSMERAGFCNIEENTVEFSYDRTDIGSYREKAFSSLHLISESAFQAGIKKMENDLQKGPIRVVSKYTLLWGLKDR